MQCGNCVTSNFAINWLNLVRFDCVMPVILIITAFGDIALCSLVNRYSLFAGMGCRRLQSNAGYIKINQAFEISAPTARIFMKFDVGVFFRKTARKIKIH